MAKNETAPKLSPNQRKAFETLTVTGSITLAAQAADVSRTTMHRWLKEPGFSAAIREQEAIILERVSGKLISAASKAVDVLIAEMENADSSASRIRAADSLLTKVLTIRELASVEHRLASIEKQLGAHP